MFVVLFSKEIAGCEGQRSSLCGGRSSSTSNSGKVKKGQNIGGGSSPTGSLPIVPPLLALPLLRLMATTELQNRPWRY